MRKQVWARRGNRASGLWANELHLKGENWTELLQTLFMSSQSTDAGQRESAFRIFTATPGIIEKQHEEAVLAAFTKGFKDSDVIVWSCDLVSQRFLI